jgi:hypothetical protein
MVVADADGTRQVVTLAGDGPPDLAVVEALARFQLMTRRAGRRMWLEDVSAPLAELLDLAGLRQEVAGQADPPDQEPQAGPPAQQPQAIPPGQEPQAGPPAQQPQAIPPGQEPQAGRTGSLRPAGDPATRRPGTGSPCPGKS